MASSSSVVRPNPQGPQVFICFRGKDVRKHFVSFLDHAMREANINVFIDEDELLGSDLVNLLKRIEESEIALVIFSEDFTSSYWCLDELAKMKERKDQGRLKVIPIFYKVEPSVVKHLKGKFGDNFRDLRRSHLHQPLRIQKWEEALVSIPETIGMPLAEQSDRTDYDFITLIVIKIQKLLEYMVVRRNQEIEENPLHGPLKGLPVWNTINGGQDSVEIFDKALRNRFATTRELGDTNYGPDSVEIFDKALRNGFATTRELGDTNYGPDSMEILNNYLRNQLSTFDKFRRELSDANSGPDSMEILDKYLRNQL